MKTPFAIQLLKKEIDFYENYKKNGGVRDATELLTQLKKELEILEKL
jgi:Tfp pilus assembly major pilin PilA